MAAIICASGQRRFAEFFFILKLIKMGSKIGFEYEFDHCRGNTWTMCEFHDSSGNDFGDVWWTDNLIYFSSIDGV